MENQQEFNDYQRYQEHLNQPMSVGEWFITILITAIPLVGIIMLFVWAFSSNTNVNKANWAKASLLWMVVGFVIAFLIFGIIGFSFMHVLDSY
jgi:hypothetical protein